MIQNKFTQQLEDSFKSKDYSLFTRRCLDFTNDYVLPSELVNQVFELRKNYLSIIDINPTQQELVANEAAVVLEKLKSQDFSLSNSPEKISDCVFKATDITKQFHSGRSPFKLHPISFELKAGEITGVVGENGNGKTTLLRIISGQLSTDTGTIEFPALGAFSYNWYQAKNKFAFIPQRIPKWHGTLLENLLFFASIHGITGEQNLKQIDYILFRLGLDKFRDLTWSQISSGYRMRFELAKMLLWRPHLLILDEPLANLDINAQQLFLQDLRFFAQSQSNPLAIILSSQQLHEIERIADNIIFIRQGKTIYNGKQIDFGINRAVNNFEVAGTFSLQELQNCLPETGGYKIEDAGTAFIISCSVDVKWFDVLSTIQKCGLELNYYRDISQSTRQLFHKDI
ncbi:ATP-binding cassette domain-containing protein [Sediminibacterium sp.]|uniref:ABC transporter ATP-binding protein n=1 Tax=Sediminibacterium sp. TaxID=1917865 RepID=UPI002720FDD7|nr:ABC transporter ATP-binding protein [Sediminibacterium sp.]MDO9000402.1 ABC transporter ATP-binding protein [Bacteroidota bacterium]MDP3147030.1 ABC transporter ATP-binding protein [Bacteroidota bacterium]MDP3567433.1 ABC transporter ATP-binding protein [Sediminibacterium sp.]